MMSKNKVKTALSKLQLYADQQNLRLTQPRLDVMEIIAASAAPLTAYDVLDALGAKMDNPKPPTAYRALEFLSQHGFIHRIESLNAYVSCDENHRHRGSQFLICDTCGKVEEVHLCHMPDSLHKQTANTGFTVSYWNAELHGQCKKCS